MASETKTKTCDGQPTVLAELTALSARLSNLLADPQPGLMTWASMLSQVLRDLAARAPELAARPGALSIVGFGLEEWTGERDVLAPGGELTYAVRVPARWRPVSIVFGRTSLALEIQELSFGSGRISVPRQAADMKLTGWDLLPGEPAVIAVRNPTEGPVEVDVQIVMEACA